MLENHNLIFRKGHMSQSLHRRRSHGHQHWYLPSHQRRQNLDNLSNRYNQFSNEGHKLAHKLRGLLYLHTEMFRRLLYDA